MYRVTVACRFAGGASSERAIGPKKGRVMSMENAPTLSSSPQ